MTTKKVKGSKPKGKERKRSQEIVSQSVIMRLLTVIVFGLWQWIFELRTEAKPAAAESANSGGDDLFELSSSNLFELRLLHMNDFHSRFEEVTMRGSKCTAAKREANKCVGGIARIKHKVDEIKQSQTDDNLLFLMAGDLFQGTLWYTKFKWSIVSNLTQSLGLDATSLGNHEFDDGLNDLEQFVTSVPYDVITGNVNVSSQSQRLQDRLLPYKIYEKEFVDDDEQKAQQKRQKRRVGVIGYVTPDTKDITSAGRLTHFEDEVSALSRNVGQLRDKGVDIVIAIGHSGYDRDLEIAKQVEGIDVIIGGHTNTFLWSGERPANYPDPVGDYPTVVESSRDGSSSKTLVLQTNGYGRFLGDITVTFDGQGRVVDWSKGQPVLLDASVAKDPELQATVDEFGREVKNFMKRPIGRTQVELFGGRPDCRLVECTLGSFISDALVDQTNASIAILNSGSFSGSLAMGEITTGDIYSAMPYDNEIDVIKIDGKTLRKLFEHSVATLEVSSNPDPSGSFVQVSGVRIVFDLRQPSGNRVSQLDVASEPKQRPEDYRPVTDGQIYEVAAPSFLVNGGDGFTMLNPANLREHKNMGLLDKDLVRAYVKKQSPINSVPSKGRISYTDLSWPWRGLNQGGDVTVVAPLGGETSSSASASFLPFSHHSTVLLLSCHHLFLLLLSTSSIYTL